MNALTKFALVIATIALPLSANATANSELQDSTTVAKSDVEKMVKLEMKLNASELVNSIKVKADVTVPDYRLYAGSNLVTIKNGQRVVINKP
ncbi:MAG: hypothetical protein ACPG8A_04545 [Psychrobium sp.]